MLSHGWAELSELLERGPEMDVMTRLQRLCRLCVEATAVTGASASVASHEARSTVCATSDLGDRLEDLQDTLSEGPTVEALRSGGAVLASDLVSEEVRWPAFTPAAMDLGVRAMFALPLSMGAARIGALVLHRDAAGELSEAGFKKAWVMSDVATMLLMLSSADGYASEASAWVLGDRSRFRPEVHQAVGATMVHLGLGPRDAFARICGHAFATNTPIGVVAAEIVARRLRLEEDPGD